MIIDNINKIIDDDRDFEKIMAEAMRKVGKAHDKRLIDEIAAMSEEEFREQLPESEAPVVKVAAWKRIIWSPYTRVAAAVIVCALVIWGIAFMPFSETKSTGYASMFSHYYTEYQATPYDIQGDSMNIHGKKSTAQLIQDASILLTQDSRQSTKRAINILETLLNNSWRKTSLDPEIHWYLGLAYLKNGQKSKAISEFEIVKDTSRAHAADAKSILRRMKSASQ